MLGVFSTSSIFADDACNGDTVVKRIVTLAPNLTEFVFAVGAGDKVVGVSAHSDYPLEALKQPVVSDYHSLDLEQIMLLQPDLIVALKGASHSAQLLLLEKKGIKIIWVDIRRIDDIPKTMRQLACLAGTRQQSATKIKSFEKQYHLLQEKYHYVKPVDVFFEISEQPLLTVSRQSLIDEVISLCGGRNIFADIPGVSFAVSVEEVLARNPGVIVSPLQEGDWIKQWQAWPVLLATERGAFITLNPDWIERAGPRVLKGARQLCKAFAQLPTSAKEM